MFFIKYYGSNKDIDKKTIRECHRKVYRKNRFYGSTVVIKNFEVLIFSLIPLNITCLILSNSVLLMKG